ncbi:putative phage abortive infection protein [Enterobacter mori]|uniref:putative phage abortive infection protein n=1 Tax=Enterobacteriaceae TaxID=543 RepID=UPI001157D85F|nr:MULTISPECIES: putative phage abortive infection protein [Klebsiella]QZY78339.1 putative phage abortive infection protein [Klebsiella sp. CTHL.F3a]VUS29515.1 hypothetical protein SB6423_00552 [Klebsiella pasteurii]
MNVFEWLFCTLTNIASGNKDLVQFFVAFGTVASVMVALYISIRNNKRDTFERNFSLLLEQHNEQLNALLSRDDFGDKLSNVLGFSGSKDLMSANQRMHKLDSYYGSYFRVLYYLLNHIDRNYYGYIFTHKKKKFYTSMVRSFLNSDITLLLIINVAHATKGNQYYGYRCLIEKYSYLEHLVIDGEVFVSGCREDVRNGLAWENGIDANSYITRLQILDDICKVFPLSSFGDNDWKEHVISVKGQLI